MNLAGKRGAGDRAQTFSSLHIVFSLFQPVGKFLLLIRSLSPVTSFDVNYLCKGPISKDNHMLRYWELGFHI